jgi:Putative polyhydroxyalkanoic acid system protein (PHA_gran_rgn)
MTIEVEHHLTVEEAKARILKLIDHYQTEYADQLQELAVDWTGDKAHLRLKAKGYSTSGNLEIREGAVVLDFYVPFLLQVFAKKIKSLIESRVQQVLS